jgi:hypothetical protein
MKSRILTAGLIAAIMIPAAAQAQTREIERDRREAREERQEYRDAQRYGDRDDVREERREYRDARRDYREEVRDWRRDTRYQNYRAPFRYRQFREGSTLRSNYYAPNYRMRYDSRWGIPQTRGNLTYVRHYDDLLLVNQRNGRVVKVYRNHFDRRR